MMAPSAHLVDALREIEDPELPVSIVDLGLIVGVAETNGSVDIKITFTSMGCPGMEMIIDDIKSRLSREPGVRDVNIDVVWDPVWTKERLSPDAIDSLREWGISV
ncbi:MAG: metal-sulfur cluster assembly factor [Chloroflexota bacterium]